MEASRFGFGENTPPSFKFDPTDADIVAHYLLPRALGLHNPYADAIIVDDPGSAPPWEILERHGHHHPDGDHAFFFGPAQDAGRKTRTLEGNRGVWMGQKGYEDTVTLLHPGGGEVDIRYKRYNLSFALEKGGPCTGYVMHEYTILSPPLPGTVLSRIRNKTQKTAKRQRVTGAYGANQQHADPVPEQPGPSYEHDAGANGDGFAGAQGGALCDSNGGGGGYHYPPLQHDFPVCEYGRSYGVSIPDQPGASYNYNAQGFTHAQPDVFYGGAYCDPSNFAPECGSEYRNYYGEYSQPWQYEQGLSNQYLAGDAAVMCGAGDNRFSGEYCQPSQYEQDPSNQYRAGDAAVMCGAGDEIRFIGEYCQPSQYEQDPSNQYQAGDAAVMCAGDETFIGEEEGGAVMCAGDEGFIGEEEAGGNSDKGSVTGTDTSARSTISTFSLCGDREDDTAFTDTLLGIGDGDGNDEQNDGGDPTNQHV